MFCFVYCFCALGLLAAGYFLGDTIWWLAVVNSFRYWLFAPALLFWLEAFTKPKDKPKDLRLLVILSLIGVWLYLWYPFYDKPATAAEQITLLTHNIYYQNNHLERFAAIVQKHQPDIIALQELTPRQYKQLVDLIGEQYPYRSIKDVSRLVDVMVFSKFPLSNIQNIQTKSGHAIHMRVRLSSGEINLVDLHTRSIEPFDLLDKRGKILATYAQYPKAIERILSHLADQKALANTVIVGDFNSTEGNQAYHLLRKKEFRDAYRLCNATLPYYSFSFPKNLNGSLGRNFTSFPFLRLDYIWLSSGLDAVSSQIIQDDTGSDHAPVIATLTLPAKLP